MSAWCAGVGLWIGSTLPERDDTPTARRHIAPRRSTQASVAERASLVGLFRAGPKLARLCEGWSDANGCGVVEQASVDQTPAQGSTRSQPRGVKKPRNVKNVPVPGVVVVQVMMSSASVMPGLLNTTLPDASSANVTTKLLLLPTICST